jgi:hypothetical protein
VRFAQYAKDETALSFVKRFCPDLMVASALSTRLSAVSRAVADGLAINKRNAVGFADCQSNILGCKYVCEPDVRKNASALCAAVREYYETKVCTTGTWNCYPCNAPVDRAAMTELCRKHFPIQNVPESEEADLKAAIAAFKR